MNRGSFAEAKGSPELVKGGCGMIYSLTTADELAVLQAHQGDVAQVFGRLEPGDGVWVYRWDAACTLPANGGTVWGKGDAGRWRLCHDGTVSLRCFGVFGTETPADDALENLIADAQVHTVRVDTDVDFARRHTFARSNITLDFTGHRVTARRIEPARHNDPFGALLHFTGTPVGEEHCFALREPLREMFDIFEVPEGVDFPLYSWWRVRVNHLTGGEEREIDKLLCVTEIIDSTHVRVNYKMGWPLEAGRIMGWQRVQPVENVCVQGMRFWGNEGDEVTGVQPLAFEYAVRCDVRDVRAWHTYWPVILRRHNTEYVTERCSLTNPIEVVVGGTGYLTQQIHCLYGSVRDCTTSNARHLNDFTGSAYCMVHNCHGDGDFHGAFVTHGQFEHDLTYVGNSGLLSFANSGPVWGGSAKRITVIRHSGFWCIGYAKVSDLTLQDVTVCRTTAYDGVDTGDMGPCGTFLMNADGLQMRGCTGDKLILTQRSARSVRPVVIRDCWFRDGIEVVCRGENAVDPALDILLEPIKTDQRKG